MALTRRELRDAGFTGDEADQILDLFDTARSDPDLTFGGLLKDAGFSRSQRQLAVELRRSDDGAEEEDDPAKEPSDALGESDDPDFSGENRPGVLNGGELIRIKRKDADDLWMMVYEFPANSGQFVAWQFNDQDQVKATFGKNWWERVPWDSQNESFLDEDVTLLGSAEQVIGVPGTFTQMMDQAMKQAAVSAGVGDPTIVGEIANDVEFQQIAAKAALGGWSDHRMMAELRQTTLWTGRLYPGITNFYGQTDEPEAAWRNYSNNVESGLRALGYTPDPDGSFRSAIGTMLDKGIDDGLWNQAAPTFVRAERSTAFRNALSQWTQAQLGVDLDFDSYFDVLDGNPDPAVHEVLELAQLQHAANTAGVMVASDTLQRIAADADLTEGDARNAFSAVERDLLAIGNDQLARFGLSQADLVSAATGITTPSGRSAEEIRAMARKAAIEIGLADDQASQLFVGFDPNRGTPERPGLNALAPESA